MSESQTFKQFADAVWDVESIHIEIGNPRQQHAHVLKPFDRKNQSPDDTKVSDWLRIRVTDCLPPGTEVIVRTRTNGIAKGYELIRFSRRER